MSNIQENFSHCNTQYAGLALGVAWLKRSKFFRFLNHIPLNLKTVKRTPRSKLEDLLVCLMAGVESLGQIDVRMRRDRGLTLAVGRQSLADQSLMSQTLDAFEARSLEHLRTNIVALLGERSRAIARIARCRMTILDLDMTELPCSTRCEGARKGRTTGKRGQTLRQLSLVYNHRYREPLDVFLHPGNMHCAGPLQEIVSHLEQSYAWDRSIREQICWRLDSGYGSDRKLSWLMRRGYRVVAKGYQRRRAVQWARSLDEIVWKGVNETQDLYERERIATLRSPHRCFLVRTRRHAGPGYYYSYLVSNLKRRVRARGHVAFYNQRQGIEKEIQQIKSVLGLKHKRKRSFNGMQSLALMTLMANLQLVWFRHSLGLDHLGLKRFIRDVIKTPGICLSTRHGLRVSFQQENPHCQQLKEWNSKTTLPLFPSQFQGILYKT
jgi:hypothetical protein